MTRQEFYKILMAAGATQAQCDSAWASCPIPYDEIDENILALAAADTVAILRLEETDGDPRRVTR